MSRAMWRRSVVLATYRPVAVRAIRKAVAGQGVAWKCRTHGRVEARCQLHRLQSRRFQATCKRAFRGVAFRSTEPATMTRHSHEIFDSKGRKRWSLGWFAGPPEKSSGKSSESGSADGSEGSPATLQAETSLKSSASTPDKSPATSPASSSAGSSASPPANSPENTPANASDSSPDGFPPLTIVKNGRGARVKREGGEKLDCTPEYFACWFLFWLVDEYPDCAGHNITAHDIETEFFPRFQAAADCHNLQLGTLLRGLREVRGTDYYTDQTGRRRSATVYWVPKPTAEVVEIASAERKRA
jgi:hypothetical protein